MRSSKRFKKNSTYNKPIKLLDPNNPLAYLNQTISNNSPKKLYDFFSEYAIEHPEVKDLIVVWQCNYRGEWRPTRVVQEEIQPYLPSRFSLLSY